MRSVEWTNSGSLTDNKINEQCNMEEDEGNVDVEERG
jgi:hypothetical protein